MKSLLLSTLRAIPHCQPTGAMTGGFAYLDSETAGQLGRPAQPVEVSINPIQNSIRKWLNLDRSTQSGRSRRNPTST